MEEGEAVRDGGDAPADDIDVEPGMESRIKEAMRIRMPHFKEQADSLTFEAVRRLIEKDLGLEMHALDEHRRFIKQLLLQCLEGGDNDHDNVSKNSGESMLNSMSSNKEVHELSDEPESKTKPKGNSSEDEKSEGSPTMGSLSRKKVPSHDNGNKAGVTEIVIKKAIMKKGAYFRANSEKITMSGVRRLLEEDLELQKHSLDSHKKFISEQLEMVLQSPEVSESASVAKEKSLKRSAGRRRIEDAERNSVSSDNENEDVEDEEKPRKKITKGRMQKLEGVKKRKVPPAKEPKTSRKKRINAKEEAADDDSESDDGKGESVGNESPSSLERSKVNKQEVSTPVYGKQVERLKSIIKSCGMSVPPAIYKKVKQVSESKREAHLIKELEGILSKEGLSTNPSEKEIKDVRKKKERAKELEGIDTSNIVSSSRRRTASRYLSPPPPKPEEPDEEEDSDNKEGDEDDEEEDDENDDGNENEDSQSEDQSEDQEDSD